MKIIVLITHGIPYFGDYRKHTIQLVDLTVDLKINIFIYTYLNILIIVCIFATLL